MADLSEEQIDLIVETWKIPTENYFDSGEYILYKFLERHQNYQAHFRRFKYTPLEELKGKPGFRDHASKIMNRISATLDCLQTEGGVSEIKMIWEEIGMSHNRRKIPRQAFLDLREVILETLEEKCDLKDPHREAWDALLKFIYEQVFENLEPNEEQIPVIV